MLSIAYRDQIGKTGYFPSDLVSCEYSPLTYLRKRNSTNFNRAKLIQNGMFYCHKHPQNVFKNRKSHVLQTAWQQQNSCFSVWYRMHRIVVRRIKRKQFIYCYYCTTVSYTTFMEHWNVKKYIYKKLCRLKPSVKPTV